MLRHIEVTFSLATEMCIKKIGCCSHQWLTVARLHAQVPRQLKHYSRSVNPINLLNRCESITLFLHFLQESRAYAVCPTHLPFGERLLRFLCADLDNRQIFRNIVS